MAAALSSFRQPAVFRLEHAENFDFSYSYSELPVLRSRNDLKFESIQHGGFSRRPISHECYVVNNDESAVTDDRFEWNQNDLNLNLAVNCEGENTTSLAYQFAERKDSFQGRKCDEDFEFGKNEEESNGEVGECGRPSAGGGRRVRRRFELQTSCTNLPPARQLATGIPDSVERIEPPKKNSLDGSTTSSKRNVLNIFQKSWDLEKKVTSPVGGNISFRRSFESSKKPAEVSDSFRKIFDFSNKSATENGIKQRKSFDSYSNVRSFENKKNFRNTFDFTEKTSGFSSDKIISSTKSATKNINSRKNSDTIELVKQNSVVINNKKEFGDKNSGVASAVWRLRNSIFSSLKLPRKVSKMAAQQQLTCGGTLGRDGGRTYMMGAGSLSVASKRKSAVELLAESKAFYVKSETVLDRKQELPLRVNSALNSSTGAHYATLSGRHKRGGGEALQSQLRKLLGSTSTQSPGTPHDSRNNVCYPDKRVGREYQEWDAALHPASSARSHYNLGTYSGNSSSGTSGSKGQVKSDPEHSRASTVGLAFPPQSLNRPSSSGDNRIFFPDSFVVPKPSRSDPANVFSNDCTPYVANVTGSPYFSPDGVDQARRMLSIVGAYDGNDDYGVIDPKVDYYAELIEDYSTISPPAEYALTERSNYRYVRSNSHSHTITKATGQDVEHNITNINSHKSLPDLHKQGENFAVDGRRLSGASGIGNHYLCEGGRYPGAASRPLPDQAVRSSEALSSYSKGTSGRSNRSSVFSSKASDGHSRRSISCHNSVQTGRGSADEVYYYNRSGSSYARDSGGSSGHCSAPGLGPPSVRGLPVGAALPVPQQRRDSGSSTQHSSARSHRYASTYYDGYPPDALLADNEGQQGLEYRVSAPLQFQDGAVPILQQSSMMQHQVSNNQQSQSMIQISQPINQQTQAMIQQSQLISQQSMSITQQPMMQQPQNMNQNTSQNMMQSQQLLSLNATVSISNVALCGGCVVGTGTSNATGTIQTQQRSRGESLVGIHFQASIPPVQFQDARPYGYDDMGDGFYGRRESGTRESRHIMTHRPASSGYNQSMQSYGREREKDEVEVSPPGLGNFKRQRCLRYKQRRPILRSKSDISDRYWRSDPKDSCDTAPNTSATPPSSTTTTDDDSTNKINQSQLDRFFNQLGMDDATYNEVILNSFKKPKASTKSPATNAEHTKRNSPQSQEDIDSDDSLVFSDISVADSNLNVLGNDYTVQGAAPKDPRLYRSCEPPSIVERNARIIKWLCNCRKLKMQAT